MTKKAAAKANDVDNDASAAATPDGAAAAKLDGFTMDIGEVTEGKSPDGEAIVANDHDDVNAPSDNDGATAAAKGDGDGASSSGATEDDDATTTNADSDEGADMEGSDDSAKAGDEGGTAEEGIENDENSDEAANEEEEEKEELWDLKVVLPASAIRDKSNMCETPGCDLVACSVWSSSLDPETPWYCCLDCQANDFGGWPEKKEELPLKILRDDHREAMLDKCTAFEGVVMPDLPSGNAPPAAASSNAEGSTTEEDGSSADDGSGKENGDSSSNAEGEDEEDGEEMWELVKVFDAKELSKKKPAMCSYGDDGECDLVACCQYFSKSEGNWFCCLDHQMSDYGGWPEEQSELPIKFLTEDNRKLILEKCANEETEMPDLPTSQPLLVTAGDEGGGNGVPAITPPPSHNEAVVEGQSDIVVGMARAKGGKRKKVPKGGVTPSPMPPSKDAAAAKKPVMKKQSAAQTQKSIEMMKKWQTDANRMGGPDARIVVSKPEAKKIIFDMIHDSFQPMNTNGAFQKLKGVVPPPTLRVCLDEMVDKFTGNPFDDDSDDEGGKSSKKSAKKAGGDSGDSYAGSLRLKEGRNLNNNLYYVDHAKLANGGNGLLPEARNELLSNMQGSKAELEQLSLTLKKIAAEAARLESEPKNEELMLEVIDLEKKMEEMKDSLEEARVYASNAKRAQQVKKGIDSMGSIWRKRKRQCIEFISMMDEATEGTISLKKCLKGDGPIDIDSDEAAITGATAFAKRKRPRTSLAGKKGGKKGGGEDGGGGGGLSPDETFIGVKLTAQGKPERVYLDEE